MIVIYAEKPDMGTKIAAALDCLTVSGKKIAFDDLSKHESAIKHQRRADGFLKINFKGEECYVTWGYGHMCGLKQAKDYNPDYKNWNKMPMPFLPSKYEIKKKDEAVGQLKIVDGLFKKADLIINSTDDDREGEVIFSYVYEILKCKKPYKRVKFNAQTKKEIIKAFDNLIDSKDVKLIEEAGRARGIDDFISGANVTAAMTLKTKADSVLSYGRVQTVVLNMLVEKELAIRSFKPVDYFTLSAMFTTDTMEQYKGDYVVKRFDKKSDADAIFDKVNGKAGVISSIEEKEVKRDGPSLLSLVLLQGEASSRYGIPMEETKEIAQFLYQNGFTTYPRTDSAYLTEDMEPVINDILDALCVVPEYSLFIKGRAKKYNKKKYFDNSKVSSHYAIIPTNVIPSAGSLTDNQRRVYDIICRSVITMLYGPAILLKTNVITTVNGEDFTTSGSSVKSPECMSVWGMAKEEMLPLLSKGQEVLGDFKVNSKKTEPPKRYTDKTLLVAMMTVGKTVSSVELKKILLDPNIEGIGRPSTRDEIIKTLLNRNYAIREKKTIYATDHGIKAIEILPVAELKSAELTANLEKRLNDIEKGKETAEHFIKDIEEMTKKWCNEIMSSTTIPILGTKKVSGAGGGGSSSASTGLKCPVCGNDIIKYSWGYGCSNYKGGCKFSISTICGKKISDAQISTLISKGKTGLIKGFTSKKGTKFDASLYLDGGSVKFKFEKYSVRNLRSL